MIEKLLILEYWFFLLFHSMERETLKSGRDGTTDDRGRTDAGRTDVKVEISMQIDIPMCY